MVAHTHTLFLLCSFKLTYNCRIRPGWMNDYAYMNESLEIEAKDLNE
jgi:hypothetical protein